ncbi:type I phosphomannose isomerase catalytic subunit [Roseivirga sp. BDSF3-8]|uniref:type I phosphomannose isomerase catalytic subunit n=1 Tax=Roseivirga sp. BDSF3-8 TaxID=3241598 RepID=UPI003531EB44
MTKLYPLTFTPIYKDKIWGGQKIKTVLEKDFGALPNCGESWEISGVTGDVSVVNSGPLEGKNLQELIRTYQGDLVGHKVYEKHGEEFPLLVKFLDANKDLSIQVHPDDKLAAERHDSKGKTEMWYIIQADEDALITTGFNQPLDQETYLEHFNNGRIEELLNREEARAGDTFFIPAGRVHTIGKGILLAEIQQTSDITYRIYDFDRTDDQGNKRELHTEQALDAIDFKQYDTYRNPYRKEKNKPVKLAECPYFCTNVLELEKSLTRSYEKLDSFVILVCTEGTATIKADEYEVLLSKGHSMLIPAVFKSITLTTEKEARLLESYIP